MIRINKLLRTAKLISKVPVRAGPGWDRPDVPPTQRVETDMRFTHDQIVYTFFDSSMPEFFLTQTQIYEGTMLEALPQFASIWSFVVGTAVSIYLFHELVNHSRTHSVIEPVSANYFLNQIRRVTEQKIAFKYSKQNPFGISVNAEQFPYETNGCYWFPKRYYSLKASVAHLQTINRQAAEYLKAAMDRAKAPKQVTPEIHH